MTKYEKYIDIAKEINSGKFDSASALLRKMNKEQKIEKKNVPNDFDGSSEKKKRQK